MSERHPASAGSSRWCCSRCRASACCCSCGSPSAARRRSSRRATACTSPSRKPVSSRRRPTCGSPAWRRPRQEDRGEPGAGGSDVDAPDRAEVRAAPAGRRGDPARRRRCSVRLPRAHAGPREHGRRRRRRDAAARATSRRRSSSTRSSARSTPARATRSRPGSSSSRSPAAGRGREIGEAFAQFPPLEQQSTKLLRVLDRNSHAFSELIRNTGITFSALSAREDQLRSLIRNTNTVFRTTAARNRAARGDVRRAADVPDRVARDSCARSTASPPSPTR